jgi:uncharacterized MAPEG superfamily protein
MTIAELSLLGAVLIYIGSIGVAKFSGPKDFDNGNPRDPNFYRSGLRARALGAQNNGIEAFPLFAVAVILAEVKQVPQGLIDALAIAFLVVRIAYVAAYLGDKPTLRSVIWSLGFAVNLAIFFAPLYAHTTV